jgi:hypothetical protein
LTSGSIPYSLLSGTVPTWNQNTTGNATTATTAGNITATSNTTLTSLSMLNTVGTIIAGTWSGSVIGSNVGGAGTVSGLMKANGSGVVSAAVVGTDFQLPISAGTGVTISTNEVSIGQTVTTTASPTFAGETLTGTLTATTANFSGNITASSLNVTGATSLSSLTASGTSTLTALTTTGAATFISTVRIPTGAGLNRVLTSDANGLASWTYGSSSVSNPRATATILISDKYVFYDGAADGTLTLPAATNNAGKEIIIKNRTTKVLTIIRAGTTETIYVDISNAAVTTFTIGSEASNNWVKLVSDGSNWVVFRALF